MSVGELRGPRYFSSARRRLHTTCRREDAGATSRLQGRSSYATVPLVSTKIPQRDLRNRSGDVLRRAEAGELITITVDGRPVAQLGPVPRRQWLAKTEYLAILRTGAPDPAFFDDVADATGTLDELDERWRR